MGSSTLCCMESRGVILDVLFNYFLVCMMLFIYMQVSHTFRICLADFYRCHSMLFAYSFFMFFCLFQFEEISSLLIDIVCLKIIGGVCCCQCRPVQSIDPLEIQSYQQHNVEPFYNNTFYEFFQLLLLPYVIFG